MVKNYMEIIVEDTLERVLEKITLECKCEKCKDDIRSLALNNLKPIYVATEKGILYTKLNEFNMQFKTDVIREIISAIDKVKENPRH